MQDQKNKPKAFKKQGFAAFLTVRVAVAVVFVATVLCVVAIGISYFEKPESAKVPEKQGRPQTTQAVETPPAPAPMHAGAPVAEHAPAPPAMAVEQGHAVAGDDGAATQKPTVAAIKETLNQMQAHQVPAQAANAHAQTPVADHQAAPTQPHLALPPASLPVDNSHVLPPHGTPTAPEPEYRPAGVAFVEAAIQPMDNELNRRFYGWRPNDILNFTDNINQFQLGTLEVTRRTVVQLTERISRTGYNDAFNRNLENAMNDLMIKADSYWFPSPESKYRESLAELEIYKKSLLAAKASFYTRADNIIPLFTAYEDLLGSCDENLVKIKEADGSKVGFSTADNYFYYAQGVANAMAIILEAVSRDFGATLENRRAGELIHHAITSCRLAASLEPWVVTNGNLDGILANHRAHIAAPISHARYYMGQLIKTLST